MTTLKQLQQELAVERKKLAKRQAVKTQDLEKARLKKEIRTLRFGLEISAGKKTGRLLKRGGRGLVALGKKVAPIVQKQARLIREQQLRDDALERLRLKKLKKVEPIRTTPVKLRLKKAKKVKRRVKKRVKKVVGEKKKGVSGDFLAYTPVELLEF